MENYYIVYINDVPMTKPISHAEAYNYAYDHADYGYIWIRQVTTRLPNEWYEAGRTGMNTNYGRACFQMMRMELLNQRYNIRSKV